MNKKIEWKPEDIVYKKSDSKIKTAKRILVLSSIVLIAFGIMELVWGVLFWRAAMPLKSSAVIVGMAQTVFGAGIVLSGIYLLVKEWSNN